MQAVPSVRVTITVDPDQAANPIRLMLTTTSQSSVPSLADLTDHCKVQCNPADLVEAEVASFYESLVDQICKASDKDIVLKRATHSGCTQAKEESIAFKQTGRGNHAKNLWL